MHYNMLIGASYTTTHLIKTRLYYKYDVILIYGYVSYLFRAGQAISSPIPHNYFLVAGSN